MSEENFVINNVENNSEGNLVNGNDVSVERKTPLASCEISENHFDGQQKFEGLINDEKPSGDNIKMVPTNIEMPKNKIRIVSLHYPADYSQPFLADLMKEAKSFHMWFERDSYKKEQIKKGGISLTFDDESTAKRMYRKTKNIKVNGCKLKIHASKMFDERTPPPQRDSPKIVFDLAAVERDDPEVHKKLFVNQLLPTTDEDLIYAVFGKENLKSVEISLDPRKKDGTKIAVLTFLSAELAEQSKDDYDGFQIDDGELSKHIKIFSYIDYLKVKHSDKGFSSPTKEQHVADAVLIEDDSSERRLPAEETLYLRSKSKREAHDQETNEISLSSDGGRGKAGSLWSAQIVESRMPESSVDRNGNEPKLKATTVQKANESSSVRNSSETHQLPAAHAQFSGELSVGELLNCINVVVERDRINWAELNSVEDLWIILNNVVKETGWQPEESLKEAMLLCLEAAKSIRDVDWWQNHMRLLIKIWTKEVDLESRSKARVKLQLKAEDFSMTTESINVEPTKEPGADYVPPPRSPKSKRKTGKKALMELMGVGALLASVQQEAAAATAPPSSFAATVVSPLAEHNERKASPASVKEVSSKSPKKSRQQKESNKRHRRSSCESGEASSTTSESEQSDDLSSDDSGSRRSRHRDARRKRRKRRQRRRSSSSVEKSKVVAAVPPSAIEHNKHTGASTHHVDPTVWMNQAMPTFMQMMPMMMQMCQMRMMSMASMNQQQQQQMMQQFQQQFAQMSQQVRPSTAGVQQQQTQQMAAFNPMEMMSYLQRMGSAGAVHQQHANGAPYSSANVQPNANYEAARPGYGYPGYPNY